MVDLKEYFYNTNNYSDPIIIKFIFEFTHKFEPTLLISLNKDFINMYFSELELKDGYSIKTDFYYRDLIDEEVIENNTNILFRNYSYTNGLFEIQEERVKFENLNYVEHREMTKRIQDFQFCMQKIIIEENLKFTNTLTSKESSVLEKETNPFPLVFMNLEVYKCFEKYTKNHIIETYSDYSYLKKRLEKEKLIHKHSDNDFVDFLFHQVKLISVKDKENYSGKYESKLKSLAKSYSINRCNNFNIVFEELISK